MSRILAIDPGPVQSAWVMLSAEGKPTGFGMCPNDSMADNALEVAYPQHVVIEMVASYGMAVGAEVFETVFWIGRLFERFDFGFSALKAHRMYRRDVKLHWCGSVKAKDSNVRQAVIDHYGGKEKAIGTKKNPGPLYGVKADVWQALALGLAWQAKGA